MPNPASYYGFKPHRHLFGGVIRPNEYRIADQASGNIFFGQPVKLADTGTILVAAAGDRLLGIFAGAQWVDTDGTVRFEKMWPTGRATLGAAGAKAMVFDDPYISFRVRSAGTPAITNIGNLADFVAGTGNTSTGISGAHLSGTMSSAVANFRILDFIADAENEVAQYAELEVQLVEHELIGHGQSTVGV
jgi:hypothetical protein